jgi:elongation factor P hydroxylase
MSLKYPLDAAQLVALFNRAFEATDNTVLQGGADEP